MFEESLVTFIKSIPAITNLINNKFFPLVIPEDTELPAGIYQLISSSPKFGLCGNYGLVSKVYQLSAWGNSYSEVKNIVYAYKTALNNYSGTFGAMQLQGCFVVGEAEDNDNNEFMASVDLEFYFNE